MGIQLPQPTLSSLGGVPETREIIAGANMSGGGDLSNDITLNASGGGGGGGWDFQPPSAADFNVIYNITRTMTLADDSDIGLTVNVGTIGSSTLRGNMKIVPVGDWDVTARINAIVPTQNFGGMGLIVANQTNDKALVFDLDNRADFRLEEWIVSSYNSVPGNVPVTFTSNPFLKISYDSLSDTYDFYASSDGKLFQLLYSYVNSGFFAAGPGFVGLSGIYDRNTGPETYFSVPYWNQSW